ncbi:MAG: signal peptidase II [Gemmatales bacterium]|nr:signal peptidase II [Gemmatales bacterium]MDW7995279.1 signal peptidase II [Gemmatales bacterium]
MSAPCPGRWMFWLLTLIVFSLDLGTKAWVQWYLPVGHGRAFLFGALRVYHLPEVNQGAFLSLGRQWGPTANLVFASISVLVSLMILAAYNRPAIRRRAFLSAALGCILGGALGNLHDRLRFGGVRDFLQLFLPLGSNEFIPLTGVFNLADSALLTGAAMLLLSSWREAPAVPQAAESPTPT